MPGPRIDGSEVDADNLPDAEPRPEGETERDPVGGVLDVTNGPLNLVGGEPHLYPVVVDVGLAYIRYPPGADRELPGTASRPSPSQYLTAKQGLPPMDAHGQTVLSGMGDRPHRFDVGLREQSLTAEITDL